LNITETGRDTRRNGKK